MTRKRQLQIAGVAALGVVLLLLLVHHSKTEADSQKPGEEGPAPVAAVVKVERNDIFSSLDIASEFLPFQEIDLRKRIGLHQEAVHRLGHARERRTAAGGVGYSGIARTTTGR